MTKFRLSVTKSRVIDLDDPDHQSLGAGWKEQTLEALREDRPDAQIEDSDPDELTGALLRCVEMDIGMCVDDLEIDHLDFKIDILDRPRVYVASKVFRADMWRALRIDYPKVEFTSRWIDMNPLDDTDISKCRDGWIANLEDVARADYLIAYAQEGDALNGTLVEIGAMLLKGGKVFLLGNYDWKTWKHHPNVILCNDAIFTALTPNFAIGAVLDRIQKGLT